MAGIRETKDLLRKEILELHKNLSAVKPEWLFSREENKNQWQEYADLAASLAKKIETLACLNEVEEEKTVIIPLVPEIKPQENSFPGISFTHKDVPTFPEVKQPEIVPVIEKSTPPIPEVRIQEVVAPTPPPAAKTFPELKSFIGFNEKLMFVRSLFNASGSDYENAVAQLNSCASYKDAETVLNNFSSANKWSPEAEPVQVFYSIVKRRFA
ncbi:MAG: hypothetical protein M3R17_19440 [Bacteroidota bacterium]|nr:hypothetical protein [Bacteroidota bacterium]